MVKIICKLMFAAAAVVTVMSSSVPAGHAAWRTEPWCAVIEYDADVTWECDYRTFEECYPNVIAGNKGFCIQNPRGPGESARLANQKPKKRHARH